MMRKGGNANAEAPALANAGAKASALDWTAYKLARNHNALAAPPADVTRGPMGCVRAGFPLQVVGLQREALSEDPWR
eukprot:scaffold43440_cov63-Phaeocystis_antarctica.AAC.4